MVLFLGTVDQLKIALKNHITLQGVDPAKVEQTPFWFGVFKMDELDMIEYSGKAIMNANSALPIIHKDRPEKSMHELIDGVRDSSFLEDKHE